MRYRPAAPPAEPVRPGPVQVPPAPPLPDNPYHRVYTRDRRFEELADARR